MKKIVILLSIVILASSPVLGAGWGVITQDTESRIDGLEKNYTLGLVNTGDSPVKLILSSSESSDYKVDFENLSITLEPSYTTESPQGSDWFYSGNGEYVNVTYTDFTFTASEERSINQIDFQISVSEGGTLNPLNRNVPRQSIINQRQFDYSVTVDQTLVKGLESSDDSIWGDKGEEQSGQQTSQDSNVDSSEDQEVDNSSQSEKEKDKQEENNDINTTTLILGTLLTLTVAYLFY